MMSFQEGNFSITTQSSLTPIHYYLLKWIALMTMLTDHIAICFLEENSSPYIVMRTIGRLAFPLFCFSLVESFWFTKDRKRHFFRLAMIMLISEIPFNLMERGTLFAPDYQNVCVTLCIGYISLWLCNLEVTQKWKPVLRMSYCILIGSIFAILNQLLQADYYWNGIVLILLLDFSKKRNRKVLFQIVALMIFAFFTENMYCMIAVLDVLFFNYDFGLSDKEIMKKVIKNQTMKRFCSIFYPLHLFVLYFCKSN